MATPTYLLPANPAGGGATVPVEGSSQAILFAVLGNQLTRGIERIAFTLEQDPGTGGYFVGHDGTVIGRLPRNLRESYPQIDHLISQGYTPLVQADIHAADSGRLECDLRFPAPALVLPANDPPRDDWALLPEGPARDIDVTQGEATRLIDLNLPAQWLAQLTMVDGIVVATLEGKVAGPLSAEDSAAIGLLVEHYLALELVPVARVYCFAHQGRRRVRMGVTAVDQLDPGDPILEPSVNPLPAIAPYRPLTGEFPVVTPNPRAHTWAVTVPGDELAETIEKAPEKPRQTMTTPAMFAVKPDGTKVLDESYFGKIRESVGTDALPYPNARLGADYGGDADPSPRPGPPDFPPADARPVSDEELAREKEEDSNSLRWAGLGLTLIGLFAVIVAILAQLDAFGSAPGLASTIFVSAGGGLLILLGLWLALRGREP